MKPIERALVRVHVVVVLPRLGDHHQHRVRQRAAGKVQKLEHLIETRRVRAAGRANWKGPLKTWQQAAAQQRFACAHPVAVALNRVDFTVVGDVSVGVSERPTWERVRAEPAMHQRQRTLDALIAEVSEKQPQLRSCEHALVDDRATRQRCEKRVLLARKFMFDAFASDEHLPIEIDACGAMSISISNEELLETGHRLACADTEARRLHRNLAPAKHDQALFGNDGLNRRHRLLGVGCIDG